MRPASMLGIGALAAASYFAFANLCDLNCAKADEVQKPSGLSSSISNVHHGIKDGKYHANATVRVSNDGPDLTGKIMINYSLCFDVPEEKGVRKMCVDGDGDSINKLDSGKNWEKVVALKYRGGTEVFIEGKSISLRTVDPHIALEVIVANQSIYSQNHQLGHIGDYK